MLNNKCTCSRHHITIVRAQWPGEWRLEKKATHNCRIFWTRLKKRISQPLHENWDFDDGTISHSALTNTQNPLKSYNHARIGAGWLHWQFVRSHPMPPTHINTRTGLCSTTGLLKLIVVYFHVQAELNKVIHTDALFRFCSSLLLHDIPRWCTYVA